MCLFQEAFLYNSFSYFEKREELKNLSISFSLGNRMGLSMQFEKPENTQEIDPKFYEELCDYMFMTLRVKFFGQSCGELSTRTLQGIVQLLLFLPTFEICLSNNWLFF